MPEFWVGGDSLNINLNIYRDALSDKYMCSRDCPCEKVAQSTQWEGTDAETLAGEFGRTLEFQFGPLEGESYTVKSFKDCILRVGENYYATQEFRTFAESWTASPDFESE